MKRLSLLVLAAASVAVVPVTHSSTAAIPLCVQYNDPIHMGSYQYCPLGKQAAEPVAAPKVPTTLCGVAELVGVDYVKDCEGGPVS